MLKILCSGAKDTTVVTVKDYHHLGKAHVYTAEDVVKLRKERDWLAREIVARAKMHQENTAAKVVSVEAGFKSSKHPETKIIGVQKVTVIVLTDWEHVKEDMVGRKG